MLVDMFNENLVNSRDKRINLFLDNLKSDIPDLIPFYLNGSLYRYPLEYYGSHKNLYRNWISPPFNFLKNRKFRFRFRDQILTLYKSNFSYYLLNTTNTNNSINQEDFFVSFGLSNCLSLIISILTQITIKYKVKVIDEVFNPLLTSFNSEEFDMILHISLFSIKNKKSDNKIFYLSIFK